MASTLLSRRVEKVVGYPPLSDLGETRRREFHEALLEAASFEDLPTRPFLPPIRNANSDSHLPMSNRQHDSMGQHIYGSMHKAARKRWICKVRAGVVSCWRCGKPIGATERWDLGHIDEDGLTRGFPTRHPEHRSCNRATVTHLKQRLAAAEAAAPSSREW